MKEASRFFEIFDSIKDGICLLDAEARILYSNRGMLNHSETSSAFTGCKCSDVMHDTRNLIDECPFLKACDTHSREDLDFKKNDRWLKCDALGSSVSLRLGHRCGAV
jgi:PAS domain-containing protein